MSKLRFGSIACMIATAFAFAALAAAPARAQSCGADTGPSILVSINGFKSRTGTVRVQSYGGDPARWFEKGTYLRRIELPAAQADQFCIPVPRPGLYAISVRHDLNGNGKSDRADGGGMSGNPDVSLLSLVLKRKPAPERVQVRVGTGTTPVQITLNYIRGSAFEPVNAGGR
jgi:uncharacterized protein (DUF2141 family)